ncbi:hypothetical protein IEO21_01218 [Rhodonia placenta]|nr:hypothetical protein IEO21_01218 [Postia placenta]
MQRRPSQLPSDDLSDVASETSTLVNFVIDSDNQDQYMLQEDRHESDVHDGLDGENIAWSSSRPRKQAKKSILSSVGLSTSTTSSNSQNRPINPDFAERDGASTSAEQ